MICDKCGARLDDNVEFCWACGNKVVKEVDNSTDDSLLNKYKNNISFFNLSDDDLSKKEEISNEEVTNPFIFPDNIFKGTLDNDLEQEDNASDDLLDSPIFPDSISNLESSNVNLGQENATPNLDSAPIFPDSISNLESSNVNLGQENATPNLESAPIFPDSISNLESSNVNLGQENAIPNLDSAPIFPGSISNLESSNVNLGQENATPNLDSAPIFPDSISNLESSNVNLEHSTANNDSILTDSTLSDNGLIDAPIFPENSVKSTELTSNIATEKQPLPVDTETVQLEINNDAILNGNEPINTEIKTDETKKIDDNKKEKNKSSNSLIVFVALAFVIFIVLAIFLTGNDSKEITCVQTETDNGLTSESTLNAIFKNNRIKSLTISGNYVIANEYVNYMDNFYESVKEELKKYSSLKGTEVTTNNDSNTITYSVTSTDSKSLFKAALNKNSETSQDFRSAAEEQGYKCIVNKN